MALALALEEAKKNEIRRNTTGSRKASVKTPFFGSRDNADIPHADLNHYDPGRATYSSTHFHIRDQFQVVVGGTGKIGRHDLAPYSVHFTRAYTPYGPLVTDGKTGFTFFVLRAHQDAGAMHLPEEMEQLKRVPDRQPWQMTERAIFPELQATAQDITLQPLSGIKDDQGLAAYALSMKANVKGHAPDASQGDGQYLVVVKGSLFYNNKEYTAPALIFIEPEEGAIPIAAGAHGLQTLVLNFPQVKQRVARTAPANAAGFKKWQCALCSFSYDEALGLPDEGIPAGTRWADVPDSWTCPDCATSKSDFQMVEVALN